ncbi:MAG: hypothetical protein DRN68_09840 [Thaumarchaeota archaeon]|nr:MAG: hypothetical protein DRN68_09840 [Nitrososphaerota archaeon]
MQKTLNYLIEQINEELEENVSHKRQKVKVDVEKLRKEWETLRHNLINSDNPERIAQEFVKNRTKSYLEQLFRVNDIPIDTRASKAEQLRQLLQLIRVSKTIQSGKPQ